MGVIKSLGSLSREKLRQTHAEGFTLTKLMVIKEYFRVIVFWVYEILVAATVIRKRIECLSPAPDNRHVFIVHRLKPCYEMCISQWWKIHIKISI